MCNINQVTLASDLGALERMESNGFSVFFRHTDQVQSNKFRLTFVVLRERDSGEVF